MKKNFLEFLEKNIVLFDGGMGTEIYSRGIFINRCYDEINISQPGLIKKIHEDYIAAGSDVIESNTFGANRFKLQAHGLADKLRDINYQGVKIAREAAGEDVYVAGGVGPLGIKIEPFGHVKPSEVKDAFKEQISPMIDAGIDLIIFETFQDLREIRLAIESAREICNLPIIAQMTVDEDLATIYGTSVKTLTRKLTASGADIVGLNCSVGPKIMLSALEEMVNYTDKPISILPNAGLPQSIDGRNIYLSSDEYLAEYARRFIEAGAKIVGGCCGTTPDHIKSMRKSISSFRPHKKNITIEKVTVHEKGPEPVKAENKSKFARKIVNREFVCSVEMVPPRGINCEKAIQKAKILFEKHIDSINIPDGPRALSRMGAPYLSKVLLDEVGIEPVLHYTARDRNLLGIMSDFLGIHALGIRNMLLITGDPPKMGDFPDATAVFDVDSIGLVSVMNSLNNGMDLGGNLIGAPTEYFIGVGVNPAALDMDKELERFEQKIQAGAEYAITQPVFEQEIFFNFIDKVKQYNIPIIAGVWPLISLRNAEFMNNEVPGATVSDKIMNKMRSAKNKEEAREIGIEIARETIREIYKDVSGIQVSMPFNNVKYPIEVLEVLKEID